jgi:hypothetical protein
LLPIGDRIPVLGTIVGENGEIILKSENDYILKGKLLEVLSGFTGFRGWIWGKRKEGDPGSIEVEGYEIIGLAGFPDSP